MRGGRYHASVPPSVNDPGQSLGGPPEPPLALLGEGSLVVGHVGGAAGHSGCVSDHQQSHGDAPSSGVMSLSSILVRGVRGGGCAKRVRPRCAKRPWLRARGGRSTRE